MKTTYLLGLLLITLLLNSCSPRLLNRSYDTDKVQGLYSAAVADAAKPQKSEIFDGLIVLDKSSDQFLWKEINGEQYLLVSSWKADTSYYKNDAETGFYNTQSYPIWVTIAPELQQRCAQPRFGIKEGVNLRLKQLLGLPPTADKAYFVEFWVRPQDLFRPCPDRETSDAACQIAFPKGTPEAHIEWVNDLRIDSYYNEAWEANYPWTELGYTYDWNPRNKTHVGLSEFVIAGDKNIVVKGFYTTQAYCGCVAPKLARGEE